MHKNTVKCHTQHVLSNNCQAADKQESEQKLLVIRRPSNRSGAEWTPQNPSQTKNRSAARGTGHRVRQVMGITLTPTLQV